MLSDEEREALQYFNTETKTEAMHYGAVLVKLIEKQSKEIEELKTQIDEHVYYDLGGRSCGKTELLRHYKKGYDMNNKFWKDKIKAKIEEIDEVLKGQLIEKIRVYFEAQKEVLQSLLEKE